MKNKILKTINNLQLENNSSPVERFGQTVDCMYHPGKIIIIIPSLARNVH